MAGGPVAGRIGRCDRRLGEDRAGGISGYPDRARGRDDGPDHGSATNWETAVGLMGLITSTTAPIMMGRGGRQCGIIGTPT